MINPSLQTWFYPFPLVKNILQNEQLQIGFRLFFVMVKPFNIGSHTLHYVRSFHFAVADGDPFDYDVTIDITFNLTGSKATADNHTYRHIEVLKSFKSTI